MNNTPCGFFYFQKFDILRKYTNYKKYFNLYFNIIVLIPLVQTIFLNCNIYDKPKNNDTSSIDFVLLLSLLPERPQNSYYNSLEIYNESLNSFEALNSTMTHSRVQHRSTLLNDGRVLITGGYNLSDRTLSSANIFNPVDNTIVNISDMNDRRSLHTQTLLNDGNVLITGGYCIYRESALSSAEIFNIATETFESVGNMNFNRCSHGALLLPDGKVFISGGTDPKTGIAIKESEIYDPITKTFYVSSNLINPRMFGIRMILTNSNELLIFGGNDGTNHLNSIERLNLIDNKFDSINELHYARNFPDVVKMRDGNILIVSGRNENGFINSAEIYNPIENSISLINQNVINPTFEREPILLHNGKILLTGGNQDGSRRALQTSEIFDPVQNNFIKGPELTIARHGQNATLLNDGNVLISGGRNIVR